MRGYVEVAGAEGSLPAAVTVVRLGEGGCQGGVLGDERAGAVPGRIGPYDAQAQRGVRPAGLGEEDSAPSKVVVDQVV